jgi:hypothetical protein
MEFDRFMVICLYKLTTSLRLSVIRSALKYVGVLTPG